MTLYSVVWVSHAEEQFNSLPVPVRQAVMTKVGLLACKHDPGQPEPAEPRVAAQRRTPREPGTADNRSPSLGPPWR